MTAKTFTEVVFTVAGEKPFPWTGIASEYFPGLVVHEDTDTLDDDAEWVVSHLPTGYRVPSYKLGALSLADALDLAVSLSKLTQWDKLPSTDAVMAWCKTHRDDLRTLLRSAPAMETEV